mmetsp:Transcript_11571/g.35796  ORF Transcript_11571/g.35796 Transcript_11571/m.35796 type:complete len:210 (+) Transcript_11571:2974-3603(+)
MRKFHAATRPNSLRASRKARVTRSDSAPRSVAMSASASRPDELSAASLLVAAVKLSIPMRRMTPSASGEVSTTPNRTGTMPSTYMPMRPSGEAADGAAGSSTKTAVKKFLRTLGRPCVGMSRYCGSSGHDEYIGSRSMLLYVTTVPLAPVMFRRVAPAPPPPAAVSSGLSASAWLASPDARPRLVSAACARISDLASESSEKASMVSRF